MTERPGAPPGSLRRQNRNPGQPHRAVQIRRDRSNRRPSRRLAAAPARSPLARRSIPGGLLPLTPQFVYTAYLVDKTTNTKQKAITETIEAEAPFANKTGGVSLVAGHTYAIQIEATRPRRSPRSACSAVKRSVTSTTSSSPAPARKKPPAIRGERQTGDNGATAVEATAGPAAAPAASPAPGSKA